MWVVVADNKATIVQSALHKTGILQGCINPCVLCYQAGIYVLTYQTEQHMWRTDSGNLPPHKHTLSPICCYEPALHTVIDTISNMHSIQTDFCRKEAILRATS